MQKWIEKIWKRVHVWKFFKSHSFFASNSSKSPVLLAQSQIVYAPKADGTHLVPLGANKTRRVYSVVLYKVELYPSRPAVKGFGLKLFPALNKPIESNFPAHVDGKPYVHGAILNDFPKHGVGKVVSPVTNFISNLEAWRGPTRFSLARLGSSEMYKSVPV